MRPINSAKKEIVPLVFQGQIKDDGEGKSYFRGPFGVFVSLDGRVYIADDLAQQILAFDRPNHLREMIGRHGHEAGELAWVDAVVVDREGKVFIADTGSNRVQANEEKYS